MFEGGAFRLLMRPPQHQTLRFRGGKEMRGQFG